MKISVIGTGYVGLVSGTCFADSGNEVWCVDIDEQKIAGLNRGEVPIYEPGLSDLIRLNVKHKRLNFTTDLKQAVENTRIVFICVGTPPAADGGPDLKYIFKAAEQVAQAMNEHKVVVIKSTVPVGTAAKVREVLTQNTSHEVDVVSNPEFLKEGAAVDDFLKPDRVVIGTNDARVETIMKELYDPFVRTGKPILCMDNASAELTKYGANALLATRISFMNELANLADRVGADINHVRTGMSTDARIGPAFLFPGVGFGGSCLVGRETVLVRQGGRTRLLRFERLFDELAGEAVADDAPAAVLHPEGLEVLSWDPESGRTSWRPVQAVTRRAFEGEALEVRTKLGRRVRCTPDHPFVVRSGDGGPLQVKLARELTNEDWLPLAQDRPAGGDVPARLELLPALEALGVAPEEVIVSLPEPVAAGLTHAQVREAIEPLDHPRGRHRVYDIVRQGSLRLPELTALGLSLEGAGLKTARNGTAVPHSIEADAAFWRVVGLYLAEGWRTVDGQRHRLNWSFHPTAEPDLVQEVAGFWRRLGVRADVRRGTTSTYVTISSRLLATWWVESLGLGGDCYSKRLPDLAWELPEEHRRALLSGLWHGDGSWSYVNQGPSVVLEYGTVSRPLADGMLRLLGGLGVAARLKVGRTAKSTVDTYWLVVSGADQVEGLLELVKPHDRDDVLASIGQQAKRIAPTGLRRFEDGAAAWLRVTETSRRAWQGFVYSLEVPGTETFVTSHGLVTHNCFPKDVDALGHTAKQQGLELLLLAATNEVNRLQKRVLFEKISARFGGDLKGKRIGMWGLAFKPRTDDMREAPSLTIIEHLLEAGATVHAYDPVATETARRELGDRIDYAEEPYQALEGADCLAVVTEWNEFRKPDWERVKQLLQVPLVFDGRNIYEPMRVEKHGIEYFGIGRGRRLNQAGA